MPRSLQQASKQNNGVDNEIDPYRKENCHLILNQLRQKIELLFTPFFNKVTCFIEDAYFALTHDQADDDLILQLHLECIKRLIL